MKFNEFWKELNNQSTDLSISAFKRYLNTVSWAQTMWRGQNNSTGRRLGQKTRQYGDYLYSQDRGMFDFYYQNWVAHDGKTVDLDN